MCAVQPQHYTNEETYFTQHSTNLIYCHFTTRTVQCVFRFSEKVNGTSLNLSYRVIKAFLLPKVYVHREFWTELCSCSFPSFALSFFYSRPFFRQLLMPPPIQCHIYTPSHVCVGGALHCVAPCIVCRSRRNKDLVNNKKESLRDQ